MMARIALVLCACLAAGAGADLLDAASWKKAAEPVFKKSHAHGGYAPGHNGLFKSPDGREDWIIYHPNSAPGEGCKHRSPRIQKFSWRDDGLPDSARRHSLSNSRIFPAGALLSDI